MLNSKSEYNRCYIPRLKLVEEEEVEEIERAEEQDLEEILEQLGVLENEWERNKRLDLLYC